MVSSAAQTVEQYLAELPDHRSVVVQQIRALAKKHLPADLEEVMNFGMIVYQVPASLVPQTYNGQPLVFAAIAAQKNYYSLYPISIYAWEQTRLDFETSYLASGKRMDVGKACIRFRNLEDLPQDVIAQAMKSVPLQAFIDRYLEVRGSARKMRVQSEN